MVKGLCNLCYFGSKVKCKNAGWCKKGVGLLQTSEDLAVRAESQPGNLQGKPEKTVVLPESNIPSHEVVYYSDEV